MKRSLFTVAIPFRYPTPVTQTDDILLDVRDLRIGFVTSPSRLAVNGISFSIRRSSTAALVGASGSGKSVTALALTRLLPSPPCLYAGGHVVFGGQDLLKADEKALRQIRGRRIAYVFQEPAVALNPVMRVGAQVAEVLHLHHPDVDPRTEIPLLFRQVRLPDTNRIAAAYPHELSGGMQQRVVLAMALAGRPELLIADEPTTALDVTIQAQMLDLLHSLRDMSGLAVLLITHNLGLVADIADVVYVMQDGNIVETGTPASLLGMPKHPYTKALLDAVPVLPEDAG